jgi:hypothetical protein
VIAQTSCSFEDLQFGSTSRLILMGNKTLWVNWRFLSGELEAVYQFHSFALDVNDPGNPQLPASTIQWAIVRSAVQTVCAGQVSGPYRGFLSIA